MSDVNLNYFIRKDICPELHQKNPYTGNVLDGFWWNDILRTDVFFIITSSMAESLNLVMKNADSVLTARLE